MRELNLIACIKSVPDPRCPFKSELDRKTGRWKNSEALSKDQPVKVKLSPGDGRLMRVAE